jgi:hypothetical protein
MAPKGGGFNENPRLLCKYYRLAVELNAPRAGRTIDGQSTLGRRWPLGGIRRRLRCMSGVSAAAGQCR